MDDESALRIVREALRLSGQRAVVGLRPDQLRTQIETDVFLPIGDVPFEWLFPKMAAVIHSGGAGTVAAAMRAGVPNVTIPFFSDQPFWSRRVAAAGAGPPPIPQRQLTAERLAGAIRRAVEDNAIIHSAAALGDKIRAEKGVQRAAEIIMRQLT